MDIALRAHIVGTSLATIIPTSIQSIRAHNARGAVDKDLLRWWAPFVAFGVLCGIVNSAYASGAMSTGVFGVVATFVAFYMVFTSEGWHSIPDLPGKGGQALMAAIVGTISTLMGIGGGTLTVPALSICSYPVRRAVGTASVVGLIIALPGAVGYVVNGWSKASLPPFSLGYVNLAGLIAIVPTSMLLAPFARAAHTVQPRTLRMLFGVFLALTSIKMLSDWYLH